MAGRRSCVNSLWSGTERVRIGERLKATLAGVLELEVLRCKQLEMVDAALEDRGPAAANADVPGPVEESGTRESAADRGSATSRRQQVSQHGSLHDQIIKYERGDDDHLPTASPSLPRGSADRFLPLPGGDWLRRAPNCVRRCQRSSEHAPRSFYTA